MRLIVIVLISIFLVPINCFAHAPVLAFSDLTDGPKTGLGDGLGSGAIVTVWGWNLGSSQGASTITVDNVNAAYVYYWGNAGAGGNSGPAELYAYHKMQEIAFSIPYSASDGAVKIKVAVGGEASNELDFYIRNGSVYWVGDTPGGSPPSDTTGEGSFGSPWATVSYLSGAESKISPGDIIYLYNHLSEGSFYVRSNSGSSNNMCALISYPGATSGTILTSPCTDSSHYCGVRTYTNPHHWVFSKLYITTVSNGIAVEANTRNVGNEIWDGSATGDTPYTDCADGGGGAFVGGNGSHDGAKILGNYVHDFGCDATSNQHHTTYFSARNHGSDIAGFEFAYNFLETNQARFGIHDWEEHACYGYTSSVLVHHNVVKDQVGPAFNIGAWICDSGYEMPGNFDIYNNLFINTGELGGHSSVIAAIALQGGDVKGHYRFYNNVIYGYGYDSASPGSEEGAVQVDGTGYSGNYPFGGTWEFINNIVVDTHDLQFTPLGTYQKPPTTSHNNLWYNGGDSTPSSAPSWDTAPLTLKPSFGNPTTDFSLNTDSPARGKGSTDVGSIVTQDLLGMSWSGIYDLGPIKYTSNPDPSPSTSESSGGGCFVETFLNILY